MIVFNDEKAVKDMIIEILVETPSIKTQEIHNKMIEKYKIQTSFQATDKAIKKMILEGVLIKDRRKILINPAWAQALREFSERIYLSTKERLLFDSALLSDVREFANIVEADNFISKELATALNSGVSMIKVLCSHAIWLTSKIDRDHPLVHKMEGIDIEIVNTRKCYLDTELSSKFYSNFGAKFRFKDNNLQDFVFAYSGKIIYMRLPLKLSEDIDKLYSKKSVRVPIEKLQAIYEKKAEIKVYLIEDEKEVLRWLDGFG